MGRTIIGNKAIVSVSIDPKLLDELDKIRQALGKSRSEVISLAVKQLISNKHQIIHEAISRLQAELCSG